MGLLGHVPVISLEQTWGVKGLGRLQKRSVESGTHNCGWIHPVPQPPLPPLSHTVSSPSPSFHLHLLFTFCVCTLDNVQRGTCTVSRHMRPVWICIVLYIFYGPLLFGPCVTQEAFQFCKSLYGCCKTQHANQRGWTTITNNGQSATHASRLRTPPGTHKSVQEMGGRQGGGGMGGMGQGGGSNRGRDGARLSFFALSPFLDLFSWLRSRWTCASNIAGAGLSRASGPVQAYPWAREQKPETPPARYSMHCNLLSQLHCNWRG